MGKRVLYALRLLLLSLTLFGALWLGSVASENITVQQLIISGGYIGVFLFSFINGFNVVVPIIAASFIPALSEAGFMHLS